MIYPLADETEITKPQSDIKTLKKLFAECEAEMVDDSLDFVPFIQRIEDDNQRDNSAFIALGLGEFPSID